MNPAPPVTKTLLPIILSGLLDSDPWPSPVGLKQSLNIVSQSAIQPKDLSAMSCPCLFLLIWNFKLAQDLKKQILKKPYSERKVVFQNQVIFDPTLKSKSNWAIIEVEWTFPFAKSRQTPWTFPALSSIIIAVAPLKIA